MMKLFAVFKKIRPLLVVGIILGTISLFAYYFKTHPEYLKKLLEVNPLVIIMLVVTNFGLISAVAVINHVSARICGVELEKRESFLLTIYSSLANFFGPLQSGPGVRAGYLKAKYKVRLRDFTFVTIIGYGFFAVISAIFLVVGVLPWWASLCIVLAACGISLALIYWFGRKIPKTSPHIIMSSRYMATLAVATFVQVAFTAVRYAIELAAVGAQVSFGQIISYAGAANFSLFVSITPDGIGVREAFLLFAQRLHGVPTHDIVAASLIDRASYVVFLAILGIIALSLHAHKRFAAKNDSQNDK